MPAVEQAHESDFIQALRLLGGNARAVDDTTAVADAIDALARSQADPPALLYEPDPLLDRLGLYLPLRARGVDAVAVRDAGRRAADIRVGLTAAPLAVAASGTLLVGGDPGGWGLAAALPWMHVVLVPRSGIEPDLPAAFARFAREFEAGRRNWVWISGPSKTADIAMQMVTGVHGPNLLEVLIVPDEILEPA